MGRRPLLAEDLAKLEQIPLFSELPPHLVDLALNGCVVQSYRAGDELFHQGERPTYLHVLLGGEVGLNCVGSDGSETVMEIMRPGEAFIAAAVLTDLPYLMGAKALLPSRVLMLPADRLRRDLRAVPDLAIAMLSSLSTHFRKMVREAKALKLNSPTQRLALYLLSLTNRREGSAVLWLSHSKSVIAARIGIRQETLSRSLATLREYGVQTHGPRVVVEDVAVLAQYCRLEDEDI
jgi:CRP/FNR family transcriptional activator FtrB